MFYTWEGRRTLDGRTEYIDLSDHLHSFLRSGALSVDISFRTEDPGYMTLLAVYYKESLLPDFSLNLNKGRAVLTAKRSGGLKVLASAGAYCDGETHLLSFRGGTDGVRVWMDGEQVIEDDAPGPYCEYGYVGFATVGRGTMADHYSNFFRGELFSLRLSEALEPLPPAEPRPGVKKLPLFARGMAGVENFRIPTLLTAGDGVVVAGADARMEAPGDNPNHICRAFRISRDSGETWSDLDISFDFGGTGRADGAAAIDGSLLYDGEEGVLYMIYNHTSAGIGSLRSVPGTGLDDQGRKRLWDEDGAEYAREADGRVVDAGGRDTGYRVDVYGRIFRGEEPCGSICHGERRVFRQLDTSFLHIIESRDNGRTWSDPRDLNPQVKAEWMKFVGAGPGTGIQLREGPHRGRLIYPVYYSSESARAYSSGAIYSDDHGRTWKRGASVNDGRIFHGAPITARDADDPMSNLGECQITELPGGRLRIFLRNPEQPRTAAAYSDDGGESWYGVAHQEALPDPECQSHVLRIRHGDRDAWLFSNPEDEHSRVRGVIKYSSDGTETWEASRLLEPGEFAYSCMAQLPDGQIGILYEGDDLTQYFAKFPVEWVLGTDSEA